MTNKTVTASPARCMPGCLTAATPAVFCSAWKSAGKCVIRFAHATRACTARPRHSSYCSMLEEAPRRRPNGTAHDPRTSWRISARDVGARAEAFAFSRRMPLDARRRFRTEHEMNTACHTATPRDCFSASCSSRCAKQNNAQQRETRCKAQRSREQRRFLLKPSFLCLHVP